MSDRDRPHHCDLALAGRILEGDPQAVEELIERYVDGVYGFVFHRVGSRGRSVAVEDVEDTCQEVFLAAIGAIGSYRGDSTLYVWLCGIASNKAREIRRRAGRRMKLEIALETMEGGLLDILRRLDEELLPQEVLERDEVRETVGLALTSLPPRHRDVLHMKYVEGQSVREIARLLKTGEKAIESLLTRARNGFKQAFTLLVEGAPL